MTILAIIRDGKLTLPRDGAEMMAPGDRVYFVCDAEHLDRAMATFAHEEPEARSVVIAGGGAIGQMLANEIETFQNTKVRSSRKARSAPEPSPNRCVQRVSSVVTRLTAASLRRRGQHDGNLRVGHG